MARKFVKQVRHTPTAKEQEEKVLEIRTPPQNPTMLENQFLAHMTSRPPVMRKSSSDSSKLMFKLEDVMSTLHPLARLMRMIMYVNGITHAEFDERHRVYAENAGFLNVQINYNRNNVKKAMFRDRLSFAMFEQIVNVVLGYGTQDIVFKLINPTTGEIEEYSLSKVQELMANHPSLDLPIMYDEDGTPMTLTYGEDDDDEE